MPAASVSFSSSTSRTERRWISALLLFAEPRASKVSHRLRRHSIRLLAFGLSFHPFDQALRPHVRPILIDEFQAGGTCVGLVSNGPAERHLLEGRPQRMLTFLVHQDVEDGSFILERIGHHFLL